MRRFASLTVSCLLAVACNNSGGAPGLSRLTDVSSDTKCPNGGVKIAVGTDKNGNGTLDDNEVTQTSEVCNGAAGTGQNGIDGMNGLPGTAGDAGVNALVATTLLPGGDSHCPTGGTQVDFGLDDGSGGGTAADGVLQPGEVLNTRYVCNGVLPYFPTDTTAPTGPAAQFVIHALGGDGVSGQGNVGGTIEVGLSPGSLGGGVKVFATGEADASFTLPQPPAFVAGAVPLTVSADLTLTSYADPASGLASGDAFFRVDGDAFVYANQSGAAVEVTSLTVAAGVTLSLPQAGTASSVDLWVRGDVRNSGTIQTGTLTDGVTRVGLNLTTSHLYGEVGSHLLLRGGDKAGDIAGSGGTLILIAGGLLINQGTIDTSGGTGSTGGAAGSISLISNASALYNTGAIDAFGGDGTNVNSGAGGSVLLAGFAGCSNSGPIDAHGGGVIAGSPGGSFALITSSVGVTRNSGTVNLRGGSCTRGSDCEGGAGGSFSVSGRGGETTHDANVDVSGGDGDYGGNGGYIALASWEGLSYSENLSLPAGSLHVSGNLLANGGGGSPGGNGGSVTIETSPDTVPQGQDVVLLGYTELDASGGAGDNSSGGNGGYVHLYTQLSYPPYAESSAGGPSGPVLNQAGLYAFGGSGTNGGFGGTVNVETQLRYTFGRTEEKVINAGDVDVSAGASSIGGSSAGGSITLEGVSGVDDTGDLTSRGGNSTSTSQGGNGGDVQVYGDDGPVTCAGAISANGGTSSGDGGGGGTVDVSGTTVTNSGNLSVDGANATAAGGNGGTLWLTSSPGATANTGTLTASAGTGTPNGQRGYVYLDGVDVTP